MSLSWAERWVIGLGARHVELARRRRFGRGLAAVQRFDVGAPADAAGPADAQPARPAGSTEALLLALADALTRQRATRGTACVVLSNELVRYAMLPWQEGLGRPAEVQGLARAHFEAVHGEAARPWTVVVHEGGWGRPSLAAAVDTALVEGLHAVLRARALRLVALRPLLMAAFNAVRGELPADAALAVVEPGRLCLSLIEAGRPREVASRRCRGSAARATDVADLAAQELALAERGTPQRLHLLLVGTDARWPADAPPGLPAVQRVGADLARQPCALAALGAV